jgi:hypothetical protein
MKVTTTLIEDSFQSFWQTSLFDKWPAEMKDTVRDIFYAAASVPINSMADAYHIPSNETNYVAFALDCLCSEIASWLAESTHSCDENCTSCNPLFDH